MAADPEKELFLKEFGQGYGYPNAPKNIDEIRATEFKRLNDVVYLDHGGATLYSELQMEDIFKDLNSTLYGNPHSQSSCSLMTNDIVGEARRQARRYLQLSLFALLYRTVLSFFNASPGEYKCIFTSGATAALKLVGETFPWSSQSTYMYTMENHNSVLGIREYALSKGAAAVAVDIEDAADLDRRHGGKSDVKIIPHTVQRRGEDGCRTKEQTSLVIHTIYLHFRQNATFRSEIQPRPESAKLLKKTYFSGGTVAASIADVDFYKRRDGIEEHFEDGTLSFMSIASLHHGFRILNALTMSAISSNEMGPTVSFNLKRPDGSWFGHREVEKLASLSNIRFTGCFCNPGACAKHLGLSHSDLLSNIEAGHVCWDDRDILHGKPTGAVRVSFGYMSTFEDARKFLKFIESSFVSLPAQATHLDLLRATPFHPVAEGYVLGFNSMQLSIPDYFFLLDVESPLSSTGLLHDREWLLKSLSGEILTQKKVPEMGFITTLVDLKLGLLIVESPRCKEKLQIELKSGQSIAGREVMEIYSQRYEVQGYCNEVDIWFSNAVGRSCTLVRSYASQNHMCAQSRSIRMCRDVDTRLNFVNEAQFLLISEESIADLNNRLRSKKHNGPNNRPPEVNPVRFRPNLVVSGGKPYAEDGWRSVRIGERNFTSMGGCNRCQMINTTFTAGTVQRSNEPLATLASYRRLKVLSLVM
ncbi:hypothetical protein DH2020_017038 [Rehmannia glutinosa]|uniref:MOSC domain-containing protein n=1 Tax=Rehmannia glutinosa TaxID=99300 RepID=A0ABR0WPN6_REHGL